MGALVGAIMGAVIGMGLSMYVARLDYEKRHAGVRTRANYRGSLVVVPVILAVLGGLIGGRVA